MDTDFYTNLPACLIGFGREHNDSNILIMGGRVIGEGLAFEIVDTWLRTAFEGGRHQRRLDKINEIDVNLKSNSPS